MKRYGSRSVRYLEVCRRSLPEPARAYSPDEDFVEAFEWSVLRNAGLSDVSVNVIGTDRPILTGGHGNPNGAEQKFECFDALSQLGPR